jgi:hypothetical protein
MSIQHGNGGIVKKGLQLYYNREFSRGFRGEPTTNLVYADYDTFENAVSTYNSGNVTVERSTTVSYFGNYSLKLTRNNTSGDAVVDMEGYILPVAPSTVYTFSVYVYVEVISIAIDILRPVYIDINGNYTGESGGGTITSADVGKWRRVSYTFTTPSNCHRVSARLNMSAGLSNFPLVYYIDGRQLERKSYATPFVRSYQTKNYDIVPRREKDINWFKAYGTSGFGSAADNNVTFAINGTGTFVRLGYGQTFGDYTIKEDDVVYKYTLGVNGCHFHGNAINIRQGEYAVFTCDYFISSDAVDPGTNGNNSTLLVFENYGGNAPSANTAVPDLTKGVWRTVTLSTAVAGAGGGTLATFLYPGYCGPGRFATSGYLLMKNPTLTINSLKKPASFKYPGNSYFPNVLNISQSYAEVRFTKNAVGNAWGNAKMYSSESYSSPCYVSFSAGQTNLAGMVGLNVNPNNGYENLDYAWYITDAGTASVFENNTGIANFGAYTTSTLFEIIYDGISVHYYMDGVLKRSVQRASTSPLYLDCDFFHNSFQVYNLGFGPYVTNTIGDGGGLLDLSGNNYSLNMAGGNLFDSGGYYFNTNTQNLLVVPAANSVLDSLSNNTHTYEIWFKLLGTPPGAYAGYLFGRQGYHEGFYHDKSPSNTIKVTIWYNDVTATAIGVTRSLNIWYHAVYVANVEESTAKLYINGDLVDSLTLTKQLRQYTSTVPYCIGGSSIDYSSNSIVSTVRAYNRALTDAEIKQNFNATRKTYGV